MLERVPPEDEDLQHEQEHDEADDNGVPFNRQQRQSDELYSDEREVEVHREH